MKTYLTLALALILLASCTVPPTQKTVPTQPRAMIETTDIPQGKMPNPASAYCVEQGYRAEIRTAADGSQFGVCIFPDGSECDEWAFYRGECQPASAGWKTYRNETLGYSFRYPADAEIIQNDEPGRSITISGVGMGEESWTISHPSDREEYRPPEGVDLPQWLMDHYLLGETRLPDAEIAGGTAVHLRHDRSPQSYAFDRYYFARSGQLYQVTIGHANDIEDWDLNRRFLESIQFDADAYTAAASGCGR